MSDIPEVKALLAAYAADGGHSGDLIEAAGALLRRWRLVK